MNRMHIIGLTTEYGDKRMHNLWNESFIEQEVTYVVVIDDTVLVIERVPARVNVETGNSSPLIPLSAFNIVSKREKHPFV